MLPYMNLLMFWISPTIKSPTVYRSQEIHRNIQNGNRSWTANTQNCKRHINETKRTFLMIMPLQIPIELNFSHVQLNLFSNDPQNSKNQTLKFIRSSKISINSIPLHGKTRAYKFKMLFPRPRKRPTTSPISILSGKPSITVTPKSPEKSHISRHRIHSCLHD